MFNKKRLLVFLVDILLIATAYCLAFLLRFDFRLTPSKIEMLHSTLLIVVIAKSSVFLLSGMYRSLWRYASLQDAVEIFKTVSVASIMVVFGLFFFRQFNHFSRSIFIFDWITLLLLVTASRLAWRAYRERIFLPMAVGRRKSDVRTLIIGAGEAGSLLLREIRKQEKPDYAVVGFVDDDKEKHGMRMNGVPVLGGISDLAALVEEHNVDQVIIAIPSANSQVIRGIINACENAHVRFKILPSITEIIGGKVLISHIKDVEIEDLLGREPVVLDEQRIAEYLTGKRVLVTGAGGSIGSELSRQVARFGPRKLILLDSAETPLYHIEKELVDKHRDLPIIPVIADIRSRKRIEALFDEFNPEVVFHAAAYKHVPMMEYNPVEAITNNIGGTRVLADMAHRFGVLDFVMISTDKAVNPTNIMGVSKRVAEIYIQALARRSRTCFTTVRFGNVLGSNGSVIPLFKEQIRNGGPITITDKRVIRYFMTIPEASQLVLQAGCIGQGGEIFVLDMGEPVRIVNLAEQLIRLSGLVPYEDIDIVFTGLRPGEKLFEELLIEGEGIKATAHSKIKVLAAVEHNFEHISAALDQLSAMAQASDITGIMQALRFLVPEFTPRYHFGDHAPYAFQRLRSDIFPKPIKPRVVGQ